MLETDREFLDAAHEIFTQLENYLNIFKEK
jgi:hypothetical protein